jgi:hypothetical protein
MMKKDLSLFLKHIALFNVAIYSGDTLESIKFEMTSINCLASTMHNFDTKNFYQKNATIESYQDYLKVATQNIIAIQDASYQIKFSKLNANSHQHSFLSEIENTLSTLEILIQGDFQKKSDDNKATVLFD